jgi:hypothetical protein
MLTDVVLTPEEVVLGLIIPYGPLFWGGLIVEFFVPLEIIELLLLPTIELNGLNCIVLFIGV